MKNVGVKEFAAMLADLGACEDAARWAQGKDLREAWTTCHNADWMLWLAARYGEVPLKALVSIACDATEPALAYTTDPRPAQTIATVRLWLEDKATLEEVLAAREAAREAAGAAWEAGAAARAAWAAARDAAEAAALEKQKEIFSHYLQTEAV